MASRPKKPKHRQKRVKTSSEASAPAVPYPKRLERETDAAYAALCTYLGAGPDRSTRSVFGPRARQAQEWSARYDWQARAAAWDSEVRASRLAAIQNRQREADLATTEHDYSLRAAAAAALLGDDALLDQPGRLPPVLVNLGRLARAPDGTAIHAAKLLVDFSGIRDLRALALHRAQATPADKETPADPAVVAAIERATPEQLAALRPSPLSVEDEYAADADPDEGG